MALETATYISDLVTTNPVGGTDPKSQGDDHIRLLKSTLKATFPDVTGAVTLSHTEINNLTQFNVKHYGAVGDGSTNDTTAIQAAITACGAAGGGQVFFPAGTYKCSSNLTVTSNYVELVGVGKYGSRIAFYATSGNGLTFSGTSLALCGIRDLGLVAAAAFTGTVLETSNVYLFTASNVHIEGGGYAAGLMLMYGAGVYINGCSMVNATSYGLKISAGNDYFVTDTTVNLVGVTGNALYVLSVTGGAVMISDSTFLAGAYCFFSGSNYMTLTGTFFDSAQGAVRVSNCTHFYANQTEVANRVSSGSGDGGGWLFGASKNFVLSDSMVLNCGTDGVTVNSDCSDFSITGNQIDANNITDAASKSGIVTGACQNFSITNNRVGNITAGFAGHQKYGIAIGSGADYYIVRGNIVLDNETAGLLDAGTGTNGVVEENIGYNPIGISSVSPPASTSTYTAGHTQETIYLTGGTVTAVKVPNNSGTTVFTTTPCTLRLGPNESFSVTYSVAPTMSKQRH